jgi:hypothetical protein
VHYTREDRLRLRLLELERARIELGRAVFVGLGRTVALRRRSSVFYRIHEPIRCLLF